MERLNMEKLHIYRGYTCDGCGRTFHGNGNEINGQEVCDECAKDASEGYNQAVEDVNRFNREV
jgi:formylmethanofuran dehydrogenase subunit E